MGEGVVMRAASPVFVGRRDELAALHAALDAAGSGRTTAVLVGGEAGAGKSRLLAEFVGPAAASGARVLTGGCLALGAESLPYAPFTQALGRLVAELGPAGVDDLLGPGRADLARLLPELWRQDDEARPAGAYDRAVLFHVVLRALEGVAGARPLVLVIEDMHWADASSRELLAFLIARLRAAVLVVATYRNDEIHRRHPLRPFLAEAARSERVARIDLGPLNPAEVAQLLEAIAGAALPRSVVDAVVARAEGNPFFAEELLAAGGGEELPPDLAEVLAARLESLPDAAHELVGVAAVSGRQVRHELLAAVAGLSGAELASGLREAAAHQILVASPSGTYAFRHALLAEAAYAQLLPAERAPLHRACAAALSSNPEWAATPARAAGEIAHHYAAGNDAPRALGALVEAAAAAAESYAFAEAITLYEQAVGLWDQVPEPEAIAGIDRAQLLERAGDTALLAGASGRAVTMVRAALEHVDIDAQPARAALLNERLSRMLWRRGEGEASLAASRAAVALMPTEPSAERARILAGQARTLLLAGRYREATEQARAAMEVARAAGARREEGDALNTYGTTLGRLGRAGEGVGLLEEALAIAESLGNIEDIRRATNNLQVTLEDGLGDPRRAASVGLAGAARLEGMSYVEGATYLRTAAAISLVTAGCWAEAESIAMAALAANADGVTAWRARMAAGTVALRRGDVGTAQAHLEAARRLCAESTDTDYRAMLGVAFAELALVEGRLADARAVVDDTLHALGETDAHDYLLYLVGLGLRAEAEQDRTARSKATSGRDRARPLYERAAAISRPASGPPWVPSVQGRVLSLLCEAEWARITGEHQPGRWSAIAAGWAEISHPYEAAYARWRTAEAHLVAGAKDDGVTVLRQAFEDASQLGAAPLVAEIEALARRARVRLVATGGPGAGSEDDYGLTDRESEVLALVASGDTNRQIAEALFMSEKTASVHVSRILAKLGVSTRGQAAALAHRLELVDRKSTG